MNFSEIGVSSYYYDLEPSGGKLRTDAEDFYVEEQYEHIERKDDGKVLVLKIRARNWEHNRLIKFVARSFHVSPRRVYFAGTKDRRSVKVQYLSIPGIRYREFSLKDVEVLDYFYVDAPLVVGSHSGNSFVVRVANAEPRNFLLNCIEIREKRIVPNYYGPQRFGALRPVTHLVGRELVRGDFKEAVRAFVGFPGQDRFAAIRKEYYDRPDPVRGLETFPESLDLERNVMRYLIDNEGDYSGAIKQLPDNLVSMFIHAYQGYIFNQILGKRMELSRSLLPGDIFRRGNEFVRINGLNLDRMNSVFKSCEGSPTGLVLGYETEFAGGMMGELENAVASREGVRPTDFKLPFGLSSKGERRDLFLFPKNMECSGTTIMFTLPPGAYATSVLREIMRTDEMANY